MPRYKERGAAVNNKAFSDSSGLNELLELFGDTVTVSDIIASNILGSISASIAKKRIQSNMTQKEFASHMGVSQGMVSKWEGGDYNFSIKTLADIAEKLDMELTVNLDFSKKDVHVKHIQNTDISYIASEKKKFIGQISKVSQCKSNFKLIENRDGCKIYSFREIKEM